MMTPAITTSSPVGTTTPDARLSTINTLLVVDANSGPKVADEAFPTWATVVVVIVVICLLIVIAVVILVMRTRSGHPQETQPNLNEPPSPEALSENYESASAARGHYGDVGAISNAHRNYDVLDSNEV
jgi:hypothetical protein